MYKVYGTLIFVSGRDLGISGLEPNSGIDKILYTPYISRGFYFREFRESGAIREFNNTRKEIYLRSDAKMRLVCMQY